MLHQPIPSRQMIAQLPPDIQTLEAGPALFAKRLELIRLEATQNLHPLRKEKLAQFLTPLPVAYFMATLLGFERSTVRLLDPGAGAGTLFAACVMELCGRPQPPTQIYVTAYELDQTLIPYLWQTVELCRELCRQKGIAFEAQVIWTDFIEDISTKLSPDLFAPAFNSHQESSYNCVVLNPPYQKVGTTSATRQHLRRVGIEVSNLYAGFLALSTLLLEKGGEMVALTPRSFCNGPYFKAFRKFFLASHKMAFTRLHLFDSRRQIFEEDAVLQENLIFHATKAGDLPPPTQVVVSAGDISAVSKASLSIHCVAYEQVVSPDDPQGFIRVISSPSQDLAAKKLKSLATTLEELGLRVSTGRVVEFRAKEFLTYSPQDKTVPLVHPTHLKDGFTRWPHLVNGNGKKRPPFIAVNSQTCDLLVPNELYVLVKRFTTKEEKRRVVAVIHDPASLPLEVEVVGFENHLNYFHQGGRGLPHRLAFGLAAFLNSTLLDQYFRQFNGHTQVNATDLRNISYPTRFQLEVLGGRILGEQTIPEVFLDQARLDELVETLLDSQTSSVYE